MPLFIAKDYNGKVIDIVLTTSQEMAQVYWQGKDVIPHSIEMRSDQDLVGHPTGALPILTTRQIRAREFGMSNERDYIVVV